MLIKETRARSAGSDVRDSYDDVLRAMVLADRFGLEDVTGLPWTEIDFPADVSRARDEVLPQIERGNSLRCGDPALHEAFAGQQVLVTGASGFIGWHVADQLVQAGAKVRALVRPATARNEEAFEWFEGDLLRRDSLDAAVKDCRYVFHVAGDYRFWARDPAGNFREQRAGDDQSPRGRQARRGGKNCLHQHHGHSGKRNSGARLRPRSASPRLHPSRGRTSARSSKPLAKRRSALRPAGPS